MIWKRIQILQVCMIFSWMIRPMRHGMIYSAGKLYFANAMDDDKLYSYSSQEGIVRLSAGGGVRPVQVAGQ